ncbi:MAG: hypothetical protein AB7V46_21860, partial [Thermomicrobiales bacterium]
LDSPARRKVVRHLTRGASAVWVLLACGDRKADDAAETLLKRELSRMEKEIVLPEQPEEDSMLLTALPLKVLFPIVRINRTDPDESAFVRMLMNSEEELAGAKGPVIFPIFGRGRALWSLEGETLTAREIEATARFLCRDCSCRVKDDNPGTDVLIVADWDGLLDPSAEVKTPAVTPTAAKPSIPPGLPDSTKEPSDVTKRPPATPWWLYGGIVAVVVVVLMSGAMALLGRRIASSSEPPSQ